MRWRRFSVAPQTRAAMLALALLAMVAILTQRRELGAPPPFASTDFGPGGFRAWAALLQREGVTTARFLLHPIELGSDVDTLVVAVPPLGAPAPSGAAADIEALAAWVRRGGRLVYLGRDPARIGIETRALQLPFFVPDVGARGALRGPDAAVVRALDDLGTNRMLLVEHPGRVELADGNGDIVVRYALGRGEVTAVSDALPFTNANIARADDARLAYLVALPGRRGGVVAFDDGLQGALIDRPWYRALPIPVRVTLTIAAIALLLGLIGSALRGASPVRLEGPREPTSQEFVDALAALHARIGARAAARDVLRRAALAAVARGVGLAADAPPAELGARLRERPGAAAVRRLIAASNAPPANDAELVASAQLAHTVWKDWMHAGSGDHGRAAFAGRARSGRRR